MAASIDPRTPVIAGAGQALARDLADGEPLAMMVRALRSAGEDSGSGELLLRRADSVRCVPSVGWQYPNAAAMLAQDLGAQPRETVQSVLFGGDGPQLLLNDAAHAIAAGELDVVLIAGAEAGASVRAAQLAGEPLPWRKQDGAPAPTRTLGVDRAPVNDIEGAAGVAPPVFMYALIDCALRAALGDPPDTHMAQISQVWSRFSAIAAENPHAWIRQAYTPAGIATPTPENRLVSTPYTKLLTANIQVNMATGVILASAAAAASAGVPSDRWVFPHAGAQAVEQWHVTERSELGSCPAIGAVGRAVCAHAGVAIDEIEHIDLYSCFPSAVQVAARELGLPFGDANVPLTLTGGLTFCGGPGNNYAGHAIAALVEQLREQPDGYGLTTAVGWYLTKHAAAICSAQPPRRPFASLDATWQRAPARRMRADYSGEASIEAYTVTYARDGTPDAAIISALTPTGERALIRTPEGDVVETLLAEDPLGGSIDLAGAGGASIAAGMVSPD